MKKEMTQRKKKMDGEFETGGKEKETFQIYTKMDVHDSKYRGIRIKNY
jgi:hypothetical protein